MITGTYTYVMQNGQIVVSGAKGGVGLLAYDDEGTLQAFSDRYSFTLSERARQELASRKLHIYVVNAAGELTEIKGSDAVGEQRDLLRTAMEDAKNLLKKVDEKVALLVSTISRPLWNWKNCWRRLKLCMTTKTRRLTFQPRNC